MTERYNEEGTFVPHGARHGNIDGELGKFRDIFLTSEREYFLSLLKNGAVNEFFLDYLINADSDSLFKEAMKIERQLEAGELETPEEIELMRTMTPEEREKFHLDKLLIAEGKMALYLAATSDKALIKELVLINNNNKEEQNGRSRGR